MSSASRVGTQLFRTTLVCIGFLRSTHTSCSMTQQHHLVCTLAAHADTSNMTWWRRTNLLLVLHRDRPSFSLGGERVCVCLTHDKTGSDPIAMLLRDKHNYHRFISWRPCHAGMVVGSRWCLSMHAYLKHTVNLLRLQAKPLIEMPTGNNRSLPSPAVIRTCGVSAVH